MSLSINADSLTSSASIEMISSKKSMMDLANQLVAIKSEFSVELSENKSTFYPFSIKKAIFKIDENNSILTITSYKAVFSAKPEDFYRFGESLLNFFSQDGSHERHLHIDKYDGFFDKMDHDLVIRLIG
ncbi:MAG: hypothetical protein E6Q83_19735 [Thiothrix sp.]|nr:MAG: hypothetical protein E6Q83_19735 [Thiothrix sp.]